MSIGLCFRCQRTYVLEHRVDPRALCIRCHQLLRLISPTQDHRLRQGRRSCSSVRSVGEPRPGNSGAI
jgi:hypothetical protein